ncbi:merozoite surface protein 5, putative [Plasmodium relictum]|uniref:Merozoite surface protein 5, putative n=1 Tax=Plasmodium relictum TaxID=85471 RepID=A0A1J1H1K9_PLARL|nr:merozoite surface protein 5, putative [Plasmodium relictum]CRG98802.1 merozoite surface protein 5, putative [Plasmodium relictum]
MVIKQILLIFNCFIFFILNFKNYSNNSFSDLSRGSNDFIWKRFLNDTFIDVSGNDGISQNTNTGEASVQNNSDASHSDSTQSSQSATPATGKGDGATNQTQSGGTAAPETATTVTTPQPEQPQVQSTSVPADPQTTGVESTSISGQTHTQSTDSGSNGDQQSQVQEAQSTVASSASPDGTSPADATQASTKETGSDQVEETNTDDSKATTPSDKLEATTAEGSQQKEKVEDKNIIPDGTNTHQVEISKHVQSDDNIQGQEDSQKESSPEELPDLTSAHESDQIHTITGDNYDSEDLEESGHEQELDINNLSNRPTYHPEGEYHTLDIYNTQGRKLGKNRKDHQSIEDMDIRMKPCTHNNGGCGYDKICIMTSHNEVACICKEGYLVGNKCVTSSSSLNPFFSLVIFFTISLIMMN